MKYKLIFGIQEYKLRAWQFISPVFKSQSAANDYILDRLDKGHPYVLKTSRIWRAV